MNLTHAARRRGLIALMATNFLMFCGFFMVIPLVSVHYVEKLGFAAAVVGIALALRQLFQQGLTVAGGALADRFGPRGLIGWGVFIRAIGFIWLAWAESPLQLFLAMILSALGGALFDAPSRAAIAALATDENRSRAYSLNATFGGIGMTVGPLLGAWLIGVNFQIVCFVAAACFLLVLIAVAALPPLQIAEQGASAGAGLGMALRNRTFVLFTALLMGYWFMWVQLTISLPLATQRITGSSNSIGLIYAINAGMTVLLQYPILRLVERWLRPFPILIIGVALMALGLGSVAIVTNLPELALCVGIFTCGTLLASPTQQSVTATLADSRALGSYFGISSLALAFGGSLGNLSGGLLIDLAQHAGRPTLPWLVFSLIGLASAIGLALLAEKLVRRRATADLVQART
ncbi:MAG: MFS transporter [Oscillochloris sp.]|nr:MFS transporter [Oscillochloris sp.]